LRVDERCGQAWTSEDFYSLAKERSGTSIAMQHRLTIVQHEFPR
jgi:hypothetical protein